MDPTPAPASWHDQFREIASHLTKPAEVVMHYLREVLRRGVVAVGAAGGSILVPDDARQHLRFLVSHGPGADKLVNMMVPIDRSIAGYVFSTGHMMALGDLQEEQPPNYYAEVSKQTGVATRTYLVVPILQGGRVRGVATYINRDGSPPFRPFQPDEMERARQYAVLEGAMLRNLERTRHLADFAAYDLSVAWAALDPSGPDPMPASARSEGGRVEPWVRLLQDMERLSEEDQEFCADLVAFVMRRRDWELGS
jgi:signal transduction protein with GAF and PtsI domain